MLFDIVTREMGLTFKSKRVFYKNYYFPLSLVVFEGQNLLGYFDYKTYTVGLNKKLMFEARDEVIRNVLRHELAHYFCYITRGLREVHGEDFRTICKHFGWDEDVYLASANIVEQNNELSTPDEKFERLQIKLKKLLALQSSDNPHEKELATIKANELMLAHNLESIALKSENDEETCVKVVCEGVKRNALHSAIYDILKTFYVSPVFNMGKGYFYLEVIGTRANVEIAHYVADFLSHTLIELYENAKKKNPDLKGSASKNAFLKGIGIGYVEKIKDATKSLSKNELMIIKHDLEMHMNRVYPRIGSSFSTGGMSDASAKNLGISAGKNLSIKPGIKDSTSKTYLLT